MKQVIAAALIGVTAFATEAWGAPVATASADVDGDGKADAIALAADGALTIGSSSVSTGIRARRGRIVVSTIGGRPAIAAIGDAEAAIVVPAGGKAWKVAAKTPVGGVGLDADYGVELAHTSIGLVRYQTRYGLKRCDGKPALLFAEGFDPNSGKFRRLSTLPIEVDAAAPALAAKLDQGLVEPVLYRAAFASHEPGSGDAGGLVGPKELVDSKLDTVWTEELAGSAGEGQLFTFEPTVAGVRAKQLRIVPGNPASAKALNASNRPKRLAIVGARAAYHVDLPDPVKDPLGSVYTVDLPQPIEGCVSVILEDSYGAAKGATAIAELVVIAENEQAGAETLLAKIVAAGTDSPGAAQQLARRGATAANAIAAELAAAPDAPTRRRLLEVLFKIEDPAAGPIVVSAIQQGWVATDFQVRAIAALRALGATAELAKLAASPSINLEARVIAVGGIAVDPAGVNILVELAGDGPPVLRRAVINRLATVPAGELAALAAAQTNAAEAGDIWRAATKRAGATAAERPAAVTAMIAALKAASDYERRYRLIDGLATLGDAAALREVRTALRALPPSPGTAALRQVAIAGVDANPRSEAVELVLELATDRDPGVRLAALDVLAGIDSDAGNPWHAPSPDGIDRVIAVALANDAWIDVRRRAATALGQRCARETPRTALETAVLSDPTSSVRGDALDALVTCRARGVAQLLQRIWNEERMPIELRVRAVGLAAKLEDPRLATVLIGEMQRWRSEAMTTDAAVPLAKRAAGVLGVLAPPGAVEALLAALGDEAFPEIIVAAANGLATLGPRCPANAKQTLQSLQVSDEGASRAIRNAAKLCGGRAP